MKQTRVLDQLSTTEEATLLAIKQAEEEEFDVDKFLEPTDPLGKQILDLVAEECAWEDVLVFLDDSLASRAISCEEWVFEVRDSVKKLFYVRELKRKVIRTLKARKV